MKAIFVPFFLFACLLVSAQQTDPLAEHARQITEGFWNGVEPEMLKELMHTEFSVADHGDMTGKVMSYEEFFETYRNEDPRFAGTKYSIEDVIAQGTKVMVRLTRTFQNNGEMPCGGTTVQIADGTYSVPVVMIYSFVGEKVSRIRIIQDLSIFLK